MAQSQVQCRTIDPRIKGPGDGRSAAAGPHPYPRLAKAHRGVQFFPPAPCSTVSIVGRHEMAKTNDQLIDGSKKSRMAKAPVNHMTDSSPIFSCGGVKRFRLLGAEQAAHRSGELMNPQMAVTESAAPQLHLSERWHLLGPFRVGTRGN